MGPPKEASPEAEAGAGSPQGAAAQQPGGAIVVDDSDADSAYAASTAVTDTTSLRSSILHYKWENGRRYHAYEDGAYWAPNDERQQQAEDLVHEMYRIVLDNKLFAAPLPKDPQNVLDLGCGTGIWAIDFADDFPSAEVIGVDLSPIQPSFVPPNCRFVVDDINKEWTYEENFFDYVHIRAMTGCVPDWTELHKTVLKHLKPGGWVEQVELSSIGRSDDGTVKDGDPYSIWVDVFKKLGDLQGKTFSACEICGDAIRDAGFVNITERRIKVPIGTWPKDKKLKAWGAWNRQFLVEGLEGFSIRGLTMLGWSYEAAQLYMAQMRKTLLDPRVHAYIEMAVVFGQKPDDKGKGVAAPAATASGS